MADTRRAYSTQRLAELGAALEPVRPVLEGKPLCVYATGSYGRLEAWEGSDADLFFLYDGERSVDPFPWFVRVAACLIDATERMGFPPFSGEGRYLEVLYVDQMEGVLGSPQDDSINAFTARMLLLLESRPVYDAERYDRLLRRVVGFYYRDFDDHAADFHPTILVNDILRFWRTLTLNYEHDRLRLRGLTGNELQRRKVKSALKNYKLKISRLTTCFSMVANLASEAVPVTAETVLELCGMTPTERLARVAQRSEPADAIVRALDEHYETFLGFVQRSDDELISELGSEGARDRVLAQASQYGSLIYDLLAAVVPSDRMRYLVV